jgi:hypothetical protein
MTRRMFLQCGIQGSGGRAGWRRMQPTEVGVRAVIDAGPG